MMVNWPTGDFPTIRNDVDGHVWRALDGDASYNRDPITAQGISDAFLSAITGAIPLPDFMSHANISRIMAAAKWQRLHRQGLLERSVSCT